MTAFLRDHSRYIVPEALVIEPKWSIYEDVWAMVEALANGQPTKMEIAPCVFHDHNHEECLRHSGQVPCMTQSESDLASELEAVKQQLAATQADDRHAMAYLEEARQATGHKGDFPSMINAISHMKKTAMLGEKFARAKGRFHSQQAMCDLMDHLGMQCVRPEKSPSKTSS